MTKAKKILVIVLAVVLIAAAAAGFLLYRSSPDSISVHTPIGKTQYSIGDTLDTAGLTLELTRRNGKTEILTGGFTCSPMELTEAGTLEITVTLGKLTTSFTVEAAPEVTDVQVLTPPDRQYYFPGDTFDPTGLSLYVSYKDGPGQIVDSGYTVLRGPDMTSPGEFAEILEYGGFEVVVPITVLPEVTFENIRFFMTSQCDDAGNGFNRSGENVNWTVMIPFDLPLEALINYAPQVECSWGGKLSTCFDLNDSFAMAKNGESTYEFFYYSAGESISGNPQVILFLMLPDDPSIEGIQSFTISVGPYSYTTQIDLEYRGDYSTGTGWDIWAV